MTTVIQCVQRGGHIVPLDQSKIKRWKEKHSEGEVYEMILSDDESTGSTPLAKKFHAIRDEYASVNGYTNDEAKVELKYLHGVWASSAARIPVGRDGRVLEYHGRKLWFLSIRDYTTEELQRLVQGSELALSEAMV